MNYLPNRLMVSFIPTLSRNRILEIFDMLNTPIIDEIQEFNTYTISTEPHLLNIIAKRLSNFYGVKHVDYDGIMEAQLIPNDPLFKYQWGALKINSTRAWNVTRGSTLVKIAILDTGINTRHPDIYGKVILSKNFTLSPTSQDLNGHGTHIAGIAAAMTRNDVGIAGIGINPKIMNVKVLDDNGQGSFSDVARGIVYAVNNGANVINLSCGSVTSSTVIQNAVQYAQDKGVLLIASAGNAAANQLFYPAAYPQCISVAALERNDTIAPFSNFGAPWVDLAAPGVSILSTLPTQENKTGQTDYGYLSGTSQATAFVSGLAALMLSLNPNPNIVRNKLKATTVNIDGTGTLYQNGRINAYIALLHV
ncbi:S8 family peptidase [Alkalihalobacillus sp. CinArs1]|uniref:S8 family peptidase n=1 Tax=Alkalihalobacillus sp. CinArs1 TaxID=2995314 RepID=UPI0022DE22FE|nr:S8 family peptidase [Alkalihalobacillus sp. CinArs1]